MTKKLDWIKVITKLPNSEQSYKGKVKTHNYINRQNQSTTGKLWKRNDPNQTNNNSKPNKKEGNKSSTKMADDVLQRWNGDGRNNVPFVLERL